MIPTNRPPVYCEICEKVATYRPQLNRTLCVIHNQEFEAEKAIRLYTSKNIEQLAAEILRQYQPVLNKQKIFEILRNTIDKSLTESELE